MCDVSQHEKWPCTYHMYVIKYVFLKRADMLYHLATDMLDVVYNQNFVRVLYQTLRIIVTCNLFFESTQRPIRHKLMHGLPRLTWRWKCAHAVARGKWDNLLKSMYTFILDILLAGSQARDWVIIDTSWISWMLQVLDSSFQIYHTNCLLHTRSTDLLEVDFDTSLFFCNTLSRVLIRREKHNAVQSDRFTCLDAHGSHLAWAWNHWVID